MDKTFKILQLINLLNSRQFVTVDMIRNVCDIAERTAYRYLNTISEANIPIYYDRQARAYSLANRTTVSVRDFELDETVMLTLALKLLARSVNPEYQRDINRVTTKIMAGQEIALEEMMPALSQILEQVAESLPDLSEQISSVLIQTAILTRRKVRCTREVEGDGDQAFEIGSPSLRFKEGWQLVENTPSQSVSTPLADIKRVQIT